MLCSCAREAIENYIRFRLSKPIPESSDKARMFILDKMHFPQKLVENLMAQNLPNDHTVINHLTFENRLCHECNALLPKYLYCSGMYGGEFKINYGCI